MSISLAIIEDDRGICEELTQPLAIVHGGKDALINGAYFSDLKIPALWRGAVQVIPESGHAPHWETPDKFDDLIDTFASECEAGA